MIGRWGRARALVLVVVLAALDVGPRSLVGAQAPSAARQLEDAIHLMETRGDFTGAVAALERLAASADRAIAARALLNLGAAYEQMGRADARRAYERIVQQFADQPATVAQARARLEALERGVRPRRATPTVRRSWEPEPVNAIGPPTRDGRLLPSIDWSTGDLVLVMLATGKQRAVTSVDAADEEGGGYAGQAMVSPDGSRVAYTWYGSAGGGLESGELWVSRLDGSGRKRIRRSAEEGIRIGGWAPDGTQVLACLDARDFSSTLALVDIGDGRVRPLKSFSNRSPRGSLSPDGRFVAYSFPESAEALERDIHVLEVATLRETGLVAAGGDERSPVWLADGRRLIFTSTRAGNAGLWMTALEDGRPVGEPVLLRGDLGRASLLGVTDAGAVFYSLQAGLADIFTTTRDSATGRWTSPRILPAAIEGSNQFPAFSPDGRYLAYVSRRGDAGSFNEPRTQAVVVHDLQTGAERSFLPDASFPIHPRWSPDGRSIVITGNIQTGIFRLDVATGTFTTVIQQNRGRLFGHAEWMPDGGSIYYGVGGEIRRHDFVSGSDTHEYGVREREWIGFVLPSHDGRSLAFTHRSGPNQGLYVTTTAFDKPRAVVTLPPEYRARAIGWSADDRGLVFLKRATADARAVTELWQVPTAGGEPASLGLAVRGMSYPAISPDGQAVAFNVGMFGWETWMLEHLVPPIAAPDTRVAVKPPGK